MPDWFAHLMLATAVSTCLRLDPWKRTLFFIGNVMPDLVRVLVIADRLLSNDAFYTYVSVPLNVGAHSLLGVLAFSLLLSLFFEPALPLAATAGPVPAAIAPRPSPRIRAWRWWQAASSSPAFLLFAGGVSHLFLDTFMWPYGGGITWLYPLGDAWFKWSFGAWWPSTFDGILWLSPFFVAAIVVEAVIAARARRGRP